jgi:hypothetical protein
MNDKADLLLVWESLRAALRKLRGQNRFRGNEEHLIQQRQIRLHREPRGGQLQPQTIVLHITPRHEDLTAQRLPSGETIAVADFNGDWEAWLAAIVDECRGADYLRSHSSHADYRKPFADQE